MYLYIIISCNQMLSGMHQKIIFWGTPYIPIILINSFTEKNNRKKLQRNTHKLAKFVFELPDTKLATVVIDLPDPKCTRCYPDPDATQWDKCDKKANTML